LFIQTLKQIERNGDPSALVELFREDSVIDSPAQGRQLAGKDGARRYWTDYLHAFCRIESEVRQALEFGDIAVFEWRSSAILRTGRSIDYQGVSVVEFRDHKIKRFATYYDAAAFATDTRQELVQLGHVA